MKLNEIVCEIVAPLYTEEGGCVNISDIWAKGELKFTYLLEVSVVPYVATYYPKITMGKTVSKSGKFLLKLTWQDLCTKLNSITFWTTFT